MADRLDEIADLLRAAGWLGAQRMPIGGDLSSIPAWVVHAGEAREISLYVADMTDEERAIVRAGCLINYNRARREKE